MAKTQTNTCVIDDRPIADTGYLCHAETNSCTTIMASDLEFLATSAPDLDVTVTRRDHLGPRSSTGKSAERALPFNDAAADHARDINEALVRLARHIATRRGLLNRHTDPAILDFIAARPGTSTETTAAARYIRSHLRWVRAQGHPLDGQPFAAVAYTTVQAAARLLARTIGPRPDMVDLGLCGAPSCDGELIAPAGARDVRCRDCGAVYSVAAIRDMQMDWVGDRLFTVAELAVLFSRRWRRRVPDGTIGAWANRGDIIARGTTADGTALYRLDEAKARCDRYIEEQDAKKAAAAAKRAATREAKALAA